MEVLSEFPRYADGDTAVMVSNSRTYQLHSHILRRASSKFAALLDEYPGAKLTAAAKRDGCTAYRFELRKTPAIDDDRFVRIRVGDNGRLLRDNDFSSLFNVSHFGSTSGREKYWDWLFGSFYNIAPQFQDHNLATILHSCMGLVDAAEIVDAIDQIREHVDLALLRQDQVLWRSIAAKPTAWTELGCRVHSPTIFREGIVHLVGLWQQMEQEERKELRPEIFELVERKWRELDMAKRAIEIRILGHYPAFLCRNHSDKPHRTSYSADIYMWQALAFYRHWHAQAMAEVRDASDGGFAFYHKIAEGGNAYLRHEDYDQFHQYFPMSSKACNVFEANMNVLKEEMKVFVKDLIVRRVHVKDSEVEVNWLTCAVIEKDDFPWEQEHRALATAKQNQVNAAMGIDFHDPNTSPLTPVDDLHVDVSEFGEGYVPGISHDDFNNESHLAQLTQTGMNGVRLGLSSDSV